MYSCIHEVPHYDMIVAKDLDAYFRVQKEHDQNSNDTNGNHVGSNNRRVHTRACAPLSDVGGFLTTTPLEGICVKALRVVANERVSSPSFVKKCVSRLRTAVAQVSKYLISSTPTPLSVSGGNIIHGVLNWYKYSSKNRFIFITTKSSVLY